MRVRVRAPERGYAVGPLPLTAGLLLPTVFVFINRKWVFFPALLKGAVRKEAVLRVTLNVASEERMLFVFLQRV